jgi:hypothetical protein
LGGGIEVNRRREKARKYERKKNRRVIKGNGKNKVHANWGKYNQNLFI